MAERPILFSAPMVRAVLAGTKTQTRRVVKGIEDPDVWAPIGPQAYHPTVVDRHGDDAPGAESFGAGNADGSDWVRCPYGQPGDTLWVREAWQADPPINSTWASTAWHGCPEHAPLAEIPERYRKTEHCLYRASYPHELARWRPSIHMPRWASRITLEVTGVRVERLQDISEADSVAEGVSPEPRCRQDDDAAAFHRIGAVRDDSFPIARYAALWESINGPGSWDANPWVWALSFNVRKAAQ